MAQNQSNVIDLFGIMEEQEPDLCIICQENLNDNDSNQQVYQIPDCKCKYHTNCIVTWFRCGSNKCPLCGNCGVNNSNKDNESSGWRRSRYYYGRNSMNSNKLSLLRNFSKKENSPKILQKAFDKLKNKQTEYDDHMLEYKEYKEELKTEFANYDEACKKLKKFRSSKWRKWTAIYSQKKYILSLPIYPIIIPTTVDMT